MIPESLYSIQIEKSVIGGILNFPNVLVEISHILDEKSFYVKEHRIFFSIIKNIILTGGKVEKTIVAQKSLDLGIRMEISAFDYLDAISFSQIRPEGIIECVKELLKLKIKRDIFNNAAAIQKYIKDSNSDPVDKIISNCDKIYNEQISQYHSEEEPQDLYAGIEHLLKSIAANPITESGLITPFKQFNSWFSGLIGSDGIYVTSGLSGQGKSAFLLNMAKGVAKLNNCKCLILDSEMSMNMNMLRAAAVETQVSTWMLKTGNWCKNKDLSNKVIQGIDKINEYKGSIYHMYVPNKDIHEIINITKRWFFRHVGRGNKCLIVYDYLKIVENLDKNRAEWQALGDRVSYLNELGYQLDSPIFSGAQQNRTAMETEGKRRDDSTTIGGSDRINQYARFNSIFREKTLEEVSEHGTQFGTHLLMPIKTSRDEGQDSYNKNKNVKIIDHHTNKVRYKRNFMNFEISEYALIEKGTYADVVRQNNLQAALQSKKPDNGNMI